MAADKDKDKKKRDQTPEEPVVRDKRRIDPHTGEPRGNSENAKEPATDSGSAPGAESAAADAADATAEQDVSISDDELQQFLENAEKPADSASEHLNDLKRVQAEYANYRKRVDRDRFLARELAIAEVMTGILPVLDDLDLAHAHGDLEGSSLELIAQKIRSSFERFGLAQVGAVGEPFDPKLHEAIAQLPSKDVTVETIADVVLPGYQLGERLLRAAKVAVSVPED